MSPESRKAADAAETPGAQGGSRLAGVPRAVRPGKPLVSVVTVVFNGAAHIEQAIRSVLAQTYDNVEYIVIDGGSTDGTLGILRGYGGRIDYWASAPDRGIYDAMNKGIAAASGELIGLLNSDDWYENGAVEEAVRLYEQGPRGQVVIVGKSRILFEDIDLVITTAPSLKFFSGMPMYHEAMFVPKPLYDAVGPYDLSYRYASDMEMTLRLRANGARFRFGEGIFVNFRAYGASDLYYREVGRESAEIARRYLPPGEYGLFRLIRFKYETLCRLSGIAERAIGKSAAGALRKGYYRLKARFSSTWE